MAIYKNKDIEVNVNEKSADVGFIDTNFYTEDKSTSSIRIIIKNNKRAVDLSKINLTPKLDLLHSDGSIFMDENINNVLPEQGIIQYKISDRVIKHPGKVNAKLFLKNETQSVHVANFNFTIKDSGITDAVNKEITVNIVDDSVRRIIQENAIELLGEGFKDDVSVELKNYVTTNTELFKGHKGDIGPQGQRGPQGVKGDTGEQGLQGPQGIRGLQGERGLRGEQGPQGIRGLEGPRGMIGPKGDKGDEGSIGPTGPKGEQGPKGNDGQDYTQSLYKVDLPLPKPFQGRNLVVIYNQFFVTIRLEGNADGSENNITPNDTTLLQLPANIPRPADTMRGVVTSISGNQTTQYTGNLVVNKAGVVSLKFDKNGSNVSTYFGGSLSYPAGALTSGNFNKGFSRKYTFPEPNVLVVQGCDYLDGYIFGAVVKKGDSDIAKSIQVIDTNNSNNSFVAQGDLGVSMGHANGMSVVGKFGNEYLLYVAHMYNPTIIPVYVDVINKTTRIGNGVITLQNESGNQIKASSLDYFKYENNEYKFGVFSMGKHYKFIIDDTNLDIPRSIRGVSMFEIDSVNQIATDRLILYADLFNQNSTHQSNRFVNGKYLMIQQNWNFSSVIEYEVQYDSKSLKRTGRYWSAYKSNKKRFEIESIFEIDGVLHGNVSEENFDGTGYDNYIISFDLHENT